MKWFLLRYNLLINYPHAQIIWLDNIMCQSHPAQCLLIGSCSYPGTYRWRNSPNKVPYTSFFPHSLMGFFIYGHGFIFFFNLTQIQGESNERHKDTRLTQFLREAFFVVYPLFLQCTVDGLAMLLETDKHYQLLLEHDVGVLSFLFSGIHF